MNRKNKVLFTALSLILLGDGLPAAMASGVNGSDHVRHDRQPQQRNRQYYDADARIREYLPESHREDSARLDDHVVFEHVGFLEDETYYTDRFRIFDQGTYQVTLTDFEFPNPLKMAGLNITTATESLGSLMGAGSFTFDADPGNYYLSFFGEADYLGQYGIEVGQYGILVSDVSAVPVPGAAWLFGSGLVGLAGVIRRKSA